MRHQKDTGGRSNNSSSWMDVPKGKKPEKFQHRVAKSPLLIPLSILDICCDICVSHPSSSYLQVFFSFQSHRFWGMALSASPQQRATEQVQCKLIALSTSRFLGSEFLETFPIVSFLMKLVFLNGTIMTLSSFPSCYRQGNWG